MAIAKKKVVAAYEVVAADEVVAAEKVLAADKAIAAKKCIAAELQYYLAIKASSETASSPLDQGCSPSS